MLRVVRRRAKTPSEPLRIIGIDDFAWRRNHRYGTIVCDLERRRPVVLLPDREPATSEAWLRHQPAVHTVARDRGGGYGEAVARALPEATQIADRWHLMENASRAFLDAVRKSMRQIRRTIGATVVNPALLTAVEKLQYESYLRREETNDPVGLRIEAGDSLACRGILDVAQPVPDQAADIELVVDEACPTLHMAADRDVAPLTRRCCTFNPARRRPI
jgi:transposase